MRHHHHAILRDPHIQFQNINTLRDSVFKRGNRVLRAHGPGATVPVDFNSIRSQTRHGHEEKYYLSHFHHQNSEVQPRSDYSSVT